MKTYLLPFLVLTTISLSASAIPIVQCELTYSEMDADGNTKEFQLNEPIIATLAGAKSSTKGFTLTATIIEMRAAGNRPMPVAGYKLLVEIKKDESTSSMSAFLPGDKNSYRYSSSLNVGKLEGFVNCDVLD